MKTGATIDREYVYTTGGTSPTLHLNEDCPPLRLSDRVRPVPTAHHPNNPVCKVCDPDHHAQAVGHAASDRKTCRECGDTLTRDGTCGFCERFEAVVGD